MKRGEQIFANLIEENKDRIFRICCYYIADVEDRKDLYQETMLNIWKGFKTFKGESKFSTWAYRITVNTALAFISKKKRIQGKTMNYVQQFEQDKSKTNSNSIEAVNLLHQGLSRLPLLDMIIISLFLEEASSNEIAAITGLTESNVRVRIHRAKEKLKEIMEGGE